MFRTIAVCLLASMSWAAYAQDIRTMVAADRETTGSTAQIVPGKHIYGIAFGTSEDDFIKKCGKPDGYIQLRYNKSAMIYGKEHMFLFREKKLSGVRITSFIFNYDPSVQLPSNPDFDNRKWELTNGIKEDTSFEDVKRIVGTELRDDTINRSNKWYDENGTRIWLEINQFAPGPDGPWTDKVGGLKIEMIENK